MSGEPVEIAGFIGENGEIGIGVPTGNLRQACRDGTLEIGWRDEPAQVESREDREGGEGKTAVAGLGWALARASFLPKAVSGKKNAGKT